MKLDAGRRGREEGRQKQPKAICHYCLMTAIFKPAALGPVVLQRAAVAPDRLAEYRMDVKHDLPSLYPRIWTAATQDSGAQFQIGFIKAENCPPWPRKGPRNTKSLQTLYVLPIWLQPGSAVVFQVFLMQWGRLWVPHHGHALAEGLQS